MTRPAGAGVLLAIDQGTTNTKVLLVDEGGAVRARASRPVATRYPRPGWVEQDAEALWQGVCEAAAECLRGQDVQVVGVALTNQREAAVLWDRATGQAVGPLLGWQCRRTAEVCQALRARGAGAEVAARTGLTIDPMFSATKMRWLLEAAGPDGPARAARGDLRLGTVDSFLLAKLTGGAVHATDLTNASRTLLLDLDGRRWDPGLADLFGIPLAALPAVLPSSARFGLTAAGGPLPAGLPIVAVAGDSHAALVGQGALRPGLVKATYGTGSSLMTPTAGRVASRHGLSSTIAWARGEGTTYALEGNIPVTGAAVDWLAGLLTNGDAAALFALAGGVPDTAGVRLVPAFGGLGAPYWDDAAEGILVGLTRGTNAGHLARAALEAMAFQVRDVFTAMEADTGARFEALLADGGSTRSDLLMQLQADVLDRPVLRTRTADGAALGVALLGGLEVGWWSSADEVARLPRPRDEFAPRRDGAMEDRLGAWQDAVARARGQATTRRKEPQA